LSLRHAGETGKHASTSIDVSAKAARTLLKRCRMPTLAKSTAVVF
jgi:hypothetical protein